MKAYLKEHQAEAFKKIAEAMGKFPIEGIYTGKIYCGSEDEFNPLTNAEQWIECLMWFRDFMINGMVDPSSNNHLTKTQYMDATASREALLIAILELIDEKPL